MQLHSKLTNFYLHRMVFECFHKTILILFGNLNPSLNSGYNFEHPALVEKTAKPIAIGTNTLNWKTFLNIHNWNCDQPILKPVKISEAQMLCILKSI